MKNRIPYVIITSALHLAFLFYLFSKMEQKPKEPDPVTTWTSLTEAQITLLEATEDLARAFEHRADMEKHPVERDNFNKLAEIYWRNAEDLRAKGWKP